MVSPTLNHPSELTKHTSLETGDVSDAALLLHQFNALSLGEGNLNAGVNTLAAIALTLANIAPPGSCLVDSDDGTRIPVGMNVLVSGGLSCGMVEDRVLTVIEARQNNIYAHISQKLERGKLREKRVSEVSAFLGTDEKEKPPTLLDRLEKGAYITEASFEEELRQILLPPSDADAGEITQTPVIYAGIGSADGLAAAMSFAHRGRLLVHTTLSGKGGATLLNQVCSEVVSGCPQRKTLGAGIRGEVIVTDPMNSLDNLLGNGAVADWLERMLWLCDHTVGPEFEITTIADVKPQLDRVGECFDVAVVEMMARRFNFRKPLPVTLEYSVARSQAEWNAFLARYESRFPGIAGTLRPLRGSLLFGLVRILQAASEDDRPRISDAQVDAFARLLALRMVSAREVILDDHRDKLIKALAASFRLKLMEGPHTVRDLMRRSNNLDSDICRKALELLVDRGDAVRRGREWQIAATTPSRTLTLNVS
jgi:hypothetical protein